MRIKNNLLDGMEKVRDGKLYAVNICLKSGEVVHLEHLEKGEKDAYVNYVRNGTEKMLIESTKQVWRILPDDIEKLDVKAYSKEQGNSVYPFVRFIMAKSRMATETFTRFVGFYVMFLFVAIFIKLAQAGIVENTDLLNDLSLLKPYLLEAGELFMKVAWLLAFVMMFMNIIDLILRPSEKYYILDEERSVLADTKLLHILITLGCIIGFILMNKIVFGILLGIF